MVKSWYFILIDRSKGTRDAFLRPMFPHISDSIFCGYLTGISSVLSGSPISVTPAIFKNQQLTEIPVCYFDKCLLKLYHIKVATIQYYDCNFKYLLLAVCGST